MAEYAKIIIDISADAVDRAFTYRIPQALSAAVVPGVRVDIPFGNAKKPKTGYVIELLEKADIPEEKLREILALSGGATRAEGDMIRLASFLAREYGSTMNQALKTVLPVKKSVRKNSRRTDPVEELEKLSANAAASGEGSIGADQKNPSACVLTAEQRAVVEDIRRRYEAFSEAAKSEPERAQRELLRPSLLHGVTGSGKTRVYIELIEYMRSLGRQTIVLIPEISLTYQTVRELGRSFGKRISVLHSRLSDGERYAQYEKAKNGEIDVMVGPRSALFTPFERLGLIVIDEEHEQAYQSDTAPRYDAREAAGYRARLSGGMVLLGSATPSLLSYTRALSGKYCLYRLSERAVKGAALPKIHITDMREELLSGNRGLFSGTLLRMMEERLAKKEQIMLFINRRGYAGFASCRSCGQALKCPHCDVSMTVHNRWYYETGENGERKRAALLSCHYCGYTAPLPARCPACGSPYIAPFGTGTQKVEAELRKRFPEAGILRMDADSTSAKGAHERILSAFQSGAAEILLGTQMIVKGHDFPRVTLVGILAADLSLYAPDYDAAERSFQLLVQAAGRAGRGILPGDVVIQTYDPSHYAVACAAVQDYARFYEREMSFRRLLRYPPVTHMLSVCFQSRSEAAAEGAAALSAALLTSLCEGNGGAVIGPCNAGIYRLNDRYRKMLYIKQESHAIILKLRDALRQAVRESRFAREVQISFDLRL